MSSIYIDTTALTNEAKRFENMSAQLSSAVDDVLNANALEFEGKAKQLAPADRGLTRQSISADIHEFLRKEISANTFYAAYMEFGTGVYAAQYAAKLPADWQAYAQQFKGKAGGTFAEMLENIKAWVKRKGIATGKDIDRAAYNIARTILIKGVKPQPFIYPAYQQQITQLEKDLRNALNLFDK